jgi:hypothetical protein
VSKSQLPFYYLPYPDLQLTIPPPVDELLEPAPLDHPLMTTSDNTLNSLDMERIDTFLSHVPNDSNFDHVPNDSDMDMDDSSEDLVQTTKSEP